MRGEYSVKPHNDEPRARYRARGWGCREHPAIAAVLAFAIALGQVHQLAYRDGKQGKTAFVTAAHLFD